MPCTPFSLLFVTTLFCVSACGGPKSKCSTKDQDCSVGRVMVRDDAPVSGLSELCDSRCRRLEVLDLKAPTREQFDDLVVAMAGIEEVTTGIGLEAGSAVTNPIPAIATVRRTNSLDGLFVSAEWSGEYIFDSLESVGNLTFAFAGRRVTKISFPRVETIRRLEIVGHRGAQPEFPLLREISGRLTISGENTLAELPLMPALRSCPLIEIGQSSELTSLRELDDVRADTLRTGSNPKLTSCEIDRTVAAMRMLNPQLQVTRSLESTLPCTP
jgi:hypothetical protein